MSRDHAQSAERSAPAAGARGRAHPEPGPATGSAETPFLELLARGASVEAYEQPVLLARAEGQPAERITALQQARVLALRVRAELEGRRRREAELSALFGAVQGMVGGRTERPSPALPLSRPPSARAGRCAWAHTPESPSLDSLDAVHSSHVARLVSGADCWCTKAAYRPPNAISSCLDGPEYPVPDRRGQSHGEHLSTWHAWTRETAGA